MEFIPVVAMATLTLKIVDFARYVRARDINGIVTQLAAWLAGVLVVLLVAQTDWADGVTIGAMSLGKLGFWSLVFYGLAAGSGASTVKDTLKAVNPNDTSTVPAMIPPTGRHRAAETTEVAK